MLSARILKIDQFELNNRNEVQKAILYFSVLSMFSLLARAGTSSIFFLAAECVKFLKTFSLAVFG